MSFYVTAKCPKCLAAVAMSIGDDNLCPGLEVSAYKDAAKWKKKGYVVTITPDADRTSLQGCQCPRAGKE